LRIRAPPGTLSATVTYSIVALDDRTGELGVAVQTRWLAVGSLVPWLRSGVGAIATQSFVDTRYGFEGIELLAAGRSPEAALAELVAADGDPGIRQVAIVDASGRAAAHTGADCVAAAGHLTGPGVSVQANMMERPTVWPAMLAAFGSADGDLADRLVAALRAAEAEGGDVRGRQSAAIVVVPGRPDAHPWEVRFDLRVDDAREPLDELERLLALNRGYESLDAAIEALAVGESSAALAFFERAAELAPDDDQIRLWLSLAVFDAGDDERGRRLYRSALEVEPRSGEHLRRFLAAGQLPGQERLVARLTADDG
jgi:uncharacterized Ntn-hydrolase superfamily protein